MQSQFNLYTLAMYNLKMNSKQCNLREYHIKNKLLKSAFSKRSKKTYTLENY